MAGVASTPARVAASSQDFASRTRPEELGSPSQQNLRASKRTRQAGAAPVPFNIGRSPAIHQTVTDSIQDSIQQAQQDAELRHRVATTLAAAIDVSLAEFQTPSEAAIAKEIRQRVVQAITTTLQHGNLTPPESGSEGAPKPRWADVAQTPKNSTPEQPKGPSQKGTRTHTKTQTTTPKDNRILLTVPAEKRLAELAPFTLRQAICQKSDGYIKLHHIPRATRTATGWAITPEDDTTRSLLLTREYQSMLKEITGATDCRPPVKWINYAVQGVESSYSSVTGTKIPTTVDLIEQEVFAQARTYPISCRPSRHGAGPDGRTTWIISFTTPVKPFRLFDTSDFASEIKKNTPIQHHHNGCQGYCLPSRCTRADRCSRCSQLINKHADPTLVGELCPTHPQCANCHGPFISGHDGCAAAPVYVRGKLTRLSKKNLSAIRQAGRRARKAEIEGNNNDINGTEDGNRQEENPQPTPPPIRATPAGTTNTNINATAPNATRVRATTQGQKETSKGLRGDATTSEESSQETARKRPTRAATRQRNLNLVQLSQESQYAPDHTESDSAPQQADTEMSEGLSC
jgi:hypothetical protein